ncbi:MAG: hypothetical protein ACRDV0_02010, partial [Acidimicrobiales bacterium]
MTGRDAARARHFRYAGLDVTRDALVGHYDLDGRAFSESVTFDVDGDLRAPAARAIAYLWYLVAGLSYYKLGAPATVDLGATEVGPRGRDLLAAALVDGLGEFAFRNGLVLDDVELTGGAEPARTSGDADPGRVLVPFGGGIDSLVALESLAPVDQALFIVSPAAGRFAAIESSASLTGRSVVRATRRLDPELASAAGFAGHVPVTAMVALLGAVAAAASGRGGVVMSNERSASVPNLTWRGREVNHQWSKSLAAEDLVALAVDDAADGAPLVASVLRDRTELWVASRFAELSDYHDVFRSCNRAFAQDPARRATTWCLECDKCLFVALVLAPFLSRAALAHALGGEPLADARRLAQLEVLVGLGETAKPFE